MSFNFQTWICPTCADDHYWAEGPWCTAVATLDWLLAEARFWAEDWRYEADSSHHPGEPYKPYVFPWSEQ